MSGFDYKHELRLARGGDREALDRLLARQEKRLERLAQARLGAALRARVRTSDVLQSTWLDVLQAMGSFEGETEEAFAGWVGRILENNIRDKGKYFSAQKRKGEQGDVEEATRAVPWRSPTPSACAASHEDLIRVNRALDQLADDYRRVILLRQVDGHSHKDVAVILGRSEAATRMLLSRARAALAVELDRLRGSPSKA